MSTFLYSLIPLFLGAAAVVQGGLNRSVMNSWGLSGATFFNNLVGVIAALLVLTGWVYAYSSFDSNNMQGAVSQFRWWYIIPGLLGTAFVMGIPYAINKIGFTQVFILLVLAQVLGGIFWEVAIDKTPVSILRICGALLTVVGAALATWK